MAKDLPYFKFIVSEWSDGDITLEDFEVQGLFINICAYYWSNECYINLTKAKKKFRSVSPDCFDSLIEAKIIKVNNDVVTINFLDEQQEERAENSRVKSKGGKASAEARRLKKLTEIELEGSASSTGVQQVLTPSSTEAQVLREEKRREEERIEKDIDFIYSLYPSKCIVKGNPTGKSIKDKEKIKSLLSDYSKDDLESKINRYVKECKDSKVFMKNFKTFLNNLPDYTQVLKPKKDENMVYYRWSHEQRKQSIDKSKAEAYFKAEAGGGRIAVIL